MEFLHGIFKQVPEIALFLSLALGFWFGGINFYKFKFGGVAGSLIFAVLISLCGVHIDSGVKALLFALFIYAVGFESGPKFFSSLGRSTLKEIFLALFMTATSFATILILARIFNLDKGIAAGLASGGLTQSAIIGTASDALSKMGFAPDVLTHLQTNVATGYAVSYVTGSIGAIIVAVCILPWFMGRDIRKDALQAETEQNEVGGAKVLRYTDEQRPALPQIVGRIFEVATMAGQSVYELEANSCNSIGQITVALVRSKKGEIFEPQADYTLQSDDQVLLVGRRSLLVECATKMGKEIPADQDMQLVMQYQDVVVTRLEAVGKLDQVLARIDKDARHGAYITRVVRDNKTILLDEQSELVKGDIVRLFGLDKDVKRLSSKIGSPLAPKTKTDFVFLGSGLIVGLLIGMLVWKINGTIPLTLGSGGGCLLSGLLFGWFRSRRPTMGELPPATSQFMKDIGLAGFVSVVGLTSGLEAIQTIKAQGITLALVGLIIATVPMLITMVFGKYVLRYKNAAVFAGALCGTHSANPAFGEVLNKAGNTIPTVPFAITYALANVLLTLLGPLVVAFV